MERTYVKDAASKTGEEVIVMGWVDTRRDHGKLIFIDIRDCTGILQVVFTPKNIAVHKEAERLRPEWVLKIRGVIKERPSGMQNAAIDTGKVELEAQELEVLNQSETPPFDIAGDGREIEEEIRLKYRYIDLRRPRLQKNICLRAKFLQKIRNFLIDKNFIEIETPLLTKSTPEGSRDFLVPSRLQPGKFYALPQSPQQYKQLLMVAGFERYFQIARALRDEDLRRDRAFEHSQIDLEMSFVSREDVTGLVEEMMTRTVEDLGFKIKEKPFPVVSYKDAVEKYGDDKFDLRTEEEKKNNILAFAWVEDFPLFSAKSGFASGGDEEWTYSHNPFTGPRPEDEEKLSKKKDIGSILSLQYDLVLNGHEIGGGGIRIHKAEFLQKVFEILGHKAKNIESEFGHMLLALRLGAPPHGGIALGIERIAAILAGEEHVREVQAFPTTASGRTAVMNAPSSVSKEQLRELGISVNPLRKGGPSNGVKKQKKTEA